MYSLDSATIYSLIASFRGTKEWDTAEFTCQNIGFDLVEIGSASEQRELMDLCEDKCTPSCRSEQ